MDAGHPDNNLYFDIFSSKLVINFITLSAPSQQSSVVFEVNLIIFMINSHNYIIKKFLFLRRDYTTKIRIHKIQVQWDTKQLEATSVSTGSVTYR